MSGRSAYVRATFSKKAQKHKKKEIAENNLRVYSEAVEQAYGTGGSPPGPSPLNQSSGPGPSSPRSVNPSGDTGQPRVVYNQLFPPHRPPPPRVVTSAIERSDVRIHMDAISAAVRNKISRVIRVKKVASAKNKGKQIVVVPKKSMERTPSGGGVQAISSSISRDAEHGPTASNIPLSEFERYKRSIRKFHGGGKLPELDWTSLSNNPELWNERGDTFVYLFSTTNHSKVTPAFRVNSQVIFDSGSIVFQEQLHQTVEPEGWPRFYPSDVSVRSLQTDPPMSQPSTPLSGYNYGTMVPYQTMDSIHEMARAPPGIRHEIYVSWPGSECGVNEVLWHLTTRNFFAILYESSAIIGTTWFEAFVQVLKRLQSYPGYLAENSSPVDWILKYIQRHRFDDVRNNPSYAASLLAFSELPEVQWREGYIEAFVHCCGMHHLGQLQHILEWKFLTPHTQIFIRNASLEMEERIHRAQVWLAQFDFSAMWPTKIPLKNPYRVCFERLRKWLCVYYGKVFGQWPPSTNKDDETWLSYRTVQILRSDFHSLYDYLVNRDIELEPHRNRMAFTNRLMKRRDRTYRPDRSDLYLLDVLQGFDIRNKFPHVPFPLPCTPDAIPVKSKSRFLVRKAAASAKAEADSRKKARAYAEASNIYTLRDQLMRSDLVMNFVRFEQLDSHKNLDPYEARRGRWVLIYGILQVLATVSVDSPHLRYKEDVSYHLSPQMKGVVPWADPDSAPEEQAEHTKSHCWKVPFTWPRTTFGVREPTASVGHPDRRVGSENIHQATPDRGHTTSGGGGIGRSVELGAAHVKHGARRANEGTQQWLDVDDEWEEDPIGSGGRVHSGESVRPIDDFPSDAAELEAQRKRAVMHSYPEPQTPDHR